jgi:hypothetical protein
MKRRLLYILVGMPGLTVVFLSGGCDGAWTLQQQKPAAEEATAPAPVEVDGGRVLVVADFERPSQGAIFRMEPAHGGGQVSVSADRPRTEGGVGSLKMSFPDPSHQAVGANRGVAGWTLHGDWTGYQMLLLNMYSPRKLGGFRLRISSGTSPALAYEHPRIMLQAGWNTIHVDLGEIGSQVNLADVREVAFWCDPLDTPTDLYLDDLVLVDNSKDLFGSPGQAEANLYVRRQGRRLVAGVPGRFELTFAQARIRAWYDLGSDPDRTHNLAGIGPIGPMMVALSSEKPEEVVLDDVSQWSGLGVAAEIQQWLVEATPSFVIIQGQWRFVTPEASAAASPPYHRWVYTVYRDGRVYVECSGIAHAEGFSPPALGLIFCCDGTMGFEPTVQAPKEALAEDAERSPAYALFRRVKERQGDLLVVPFIPQEGRGLSSPSDPRQCCLWPMSVARGSFATAFMVRVWPGDIDTVQQAEAMARDYITPLPVGLTVGELVRTDIGDFDNDGFNESRGCYVLQLAGDVGRMEIDGRRQVRFGPVLKIVGVAGRDVWVYLDGRLLEEMYRDADQDLIVRLPDIAGRKALVEIFAREHAGE